MGMEKVVDTSPILDEMLLDVATEIELTNHDRDIADRRFARLRQHLARLESPLRPYLVDAAAQIYPQGSMSIGTTVVNGRDDDRYDVDAIVEIDVPAHWTPQDVRDNLEVALEGFPGVDDIEACTRCVQLRFPNMHMDVTILDPKDGATAPRQGDIFHTPDRGQHTRVPSNPFGFSHWYRRAVSIHADFAKALASRRGRSHDRLQESALEKVLARSQSQLTPSIPPRLDSEQVVALKLLKRHINIEYENKDLRRPPSIYFTKHSADVGPIDSGLTDQLIALAYFTSQKLRACLVSNTMPDERNPTYDQDRINDRWPTSQQDMKVCAETLEDLASSLVNAKSMAMGDIVKLFSRLFGERVSANVYKTLSKRYEQSASHKGMDYERGVGTVIAASGMASPGIARASAPRQTFHRGELVEGIATLLTNVIQRLRE